MGAVTVKKEGEGIRRRREKEREIELEIERRRGRADRQTERECNQLPGSEYVINFSHCYEQNLSCISNYPKKIPGRKASQ